MVTRPKKICFARLKRAVKRI